LLPPIDEAERWEQLRPGTLNRLLDEIEREENHRRSIERTGQRYAMGTVVLLAFLAGFFVFCGAATQGAAIIVVGAVSLVTVFLTNRFAKPERTKKLE
jgi:uncharacterized membrane protein